MIAATALGNQADPVYGAANAQPNSAAQRAAMLEKFVMETVVIVIHLIVVLALVGVVLLQRSEGGGLGIGGGSGFMTARGAANALTRTTAVLAVAFFATSLGLSLIARYGEQPTDILDRVSGQPAQQGELLDQLGGGVSGAGKPADTGAQTGNDAMPQPALPVSPVPSGQ